MSYSNALNWLFRQTRAGNPRDPERMRRLIATLKLHQPPKSIHVVGTNGKGSVSHLIAGGLSAAGLKVGRFSSPHVEDFRERIVVNGREIGKREVIDFVEEVKGLEPPYAFFELSFALALKTFAEHDVDIAVVEAGVGARQDATVILENVILSILTNVSLDHQETLGGSLEAITKDKAHVMRPNVPFVTSERNPLVLDGLRQHADGLKAPFYSPGETPELFEFVGEVHSDVDKQNKRLAYAALRLLDIEEHHIIEGLENAAPLPARQERFITGNKTVILDGGHNVAAVAALAETVGQADILLFGSLAKREGKDLFDILRPQFSKLIVTSVEGARPEWLEPTQTFIPNSLNALETALETLPPNGTLVVAGSLYLAGQLRMRLRDLVRG